VELELPLIVLAFVPWARHLSCEASSCPGGGGASESFTRSRRCSVVRATSLAMMNVSSSVECCSDLKCDRDRGWFSWCRSSSCCWHGGLWLFGDVCPLGPCSVRMTACKTAQAQRWHVGFDCPLVHNVLLCHCGQHCGHSFILFFVWFGLVFYNMRQLLIIYTLDTIWVFLELLKKGCRIIDRNLELGQKGK
jgi:hypothetical protein